MASSVGYLRGFYIVSYGLAIYNLNLLLGFLTPQIDPESEGPELPTTSDQEFRPFIRRLPEFKFWYASIKSFVVGFGMTFFSVFDVPVFWPILLLYWCVLFFVTMKRQIRHMIKYRYLPFSFGKKDERTLRSSNAGSVADTMAELERSVSVRAVGEGPSGSTSKYNNFQDVASAADQVVEGFGRRSAPVVSFGVSSPPAAAAPPFGSAFKASSMAAAARRSPGRLLSPSYSATPGSPGMSSRKDSSKNPSQEMLRPGFINTPELARSAAPPTITSLPQLPQNGGPHLTSALTPGLREALSAPVSTPPVVAAVRERAQAIRGKLMQLMSGWAVLEEGARQTFHMQASDGLAEVFARAAVPWPPPEAPAPAGDQRSLSQGVVHSRAPSHPGSASQASLFHTDPLSGPSQDTLQANGLSQHRQQLAGYPHSPPASMQGVSGYTNPAHASSFGMQQQQQAHHQPQQNGSLIMPPPQQQQQQHQPQQNGSIMPQQHQQQHQPGSHIQAHQQQAPDDQHAHHHQNVSAHTPALISPRLWSPTRGQAPPWQAPLVRYGSSSPDQTAPSHGHDARRVLQPQQQQAQVQGQCQQPRAQMQPQQQLVQTLPQQPQPQQSQQQQQQLQQPQQQQQLQPQVQQQQQQPYVYGAARSHTPASPVGHSGPPPLASQPHPQMALHQPMSLGQGQDGVSKPHGSGGQGAMDGAARGAQPYTYGLPTLRTSQEGQRGHHSTAPPMIGIGPSQPTPHGLGPGDLGSYPYGSSNVGRAGAAYASAPPALAMYQSLDGVGAEASFTHMHAYS
ncbi:MAG: hypothetical protein WDW38_002402 [Sanguina aurantia]